MPHLPSRSEFFSIRGLRYHVRHWGPDDAPRLFLLHGWMDCSATFQFLVDALHQAWHLVAPDWRGYGETEWLGRPYWFPDYYADLDALLRHYSPDEPARIVGHSMGASIGATYAAVRPERVARLVMLDFLGLPPNPEQNLPDQIGKWLDAIDAAPALRVYENPEALARRLMAANPRLREDRAQWLARNISRPHAAGGIELACDPWHKVPSPTRYDIDDVMDTWRRIRAPLLKIIADQGYVAQRFSPESAEYQRRIACFATARVVPLADAGHNVQHDQPEAVAAEIEAFMAADVGA